MSKVIRLSDSTIEVLEKIRIHFIDNATDPVVRKKFEESNEDDLIRPILEAFMEINLNI